MIFMYEDKKHFSNFTACNDVNASGIKRFGRSPLIGAMTSTLTWIEGQTITFRYEESFPQLELLDVNKHKDTIHYIIPSGVNHNPKDWAGGYPPSEGRSLFDYLNNKYLKDLRNNEAFLLLDQSLEGYHAPWLWDFFHSECDRKGFNPFNIIYVTGDIIASETYSKWADENNIPPTNRMLVLGYPHFQIDVFLNSSNKVHLFKDPLPSFEDHIKHKTENLNDIKTYACLNKRLRAHRIWFYTYLYYNNLLDKGLVSMNPYNSNMLIQWEEKKMEEERFAEPLKILPLNIYGKSNKELGDNFYITRFNPEVCLDTWVNVVPEASYGDLDGNVFLSEKIFKPIACNHPFIVLGSKGSLKELRKLGYKTFDGWIDESYDELSTWERFEAIIDAIKKIDAIEDKLEWYKSMEPIIKHNYETLKRNVLNEAPPAFDKIKERYLTRYSSNCKN
jgi:hypothetical protein